MKKRLSLIMLCILLTSMMAFFVNIQPAKAFSTIHVPADYLTIQAAINVASPGDMIMVASGTYNEEVNINKAVKVLGSGASTTFIDGTGVVLASAGLVKITAIGDVTFSGFTVQHAPAGGGVTIGILSQCGVAGETYTISYNNIYGTNDPNNDKDYGFYSQSDSANVVFTHNLVTQTGCNNIVLELHTGTTEISGNTLDAGVWGTDAIFIMTYNGKDVTTLQNVSYNMFDMSTGGPFDYDHRASAISFDTWPIAPDAKFTNVIIQGNTINNLKNYRRGIGFWNGGGGGGGAIAPLVESNIITGIMGSTGSYGIDFVGTNAAQNAIVMYNKISNADWGIYLRTAGCAPGAKIHYNDIAGNNRGLDNAVGPPEVDARFNWWGDSSGPFHSVTNTGGLGNNVTDNVDYSPWLGFVVGTSPMTWYVNPTGTIQEAIDEASSGDTIIVHTGTYRETLVINKSIILKSASKPVIEAPDTRKTYTIPESSAIFDPIIVAYGGLESGGIISGSGTISVTIDGFEIDGRNTAGSARFVAILYRNVKLGTISNINVHSMYPPDGQGHGPETFGILAYGNSNLTIENNNVKDFSRGGIGVNGDDGPLPDPTASVKHNTVLGNGLELYADWWAENGIQIGYGASGGIIENNVTDCKVNNLYWVSTGILVISAAQGMSILRNNVAECDTGIAVTAEGSPSLDVVDGNNVTLCTYDAIRLGLDGQVDHVTVSNNLISESMFGVGVWDTSNNNITNNIIAENQYGVDIDGNSNNNQVTHNDIVANTADGIIVGPYGGFDPSGTQIHYNNITGNSGYGVEVTSANVADARLNWWGSQSGPYHSALNPTGLGDEVTDNVDFIPWLQIIHDVVVTDVSVSPLTVIAGQTVAINVTVNNLGSDYENFTVTAYYDSTAISSQNVTNLLPNWNLSLTFYWNTAGMSRGNYTIKAVASTVPGEIDTANNVFIDGKVQVLWHDVAVVNITPDRNWVFQGNSANINVTVKNNGDFSETVAVTLYYNITDNKIIGTQNTNLLVGESKTLLYVWNTTNVPYCHNYTITAVATIPVDTNPSDNTLSDGKIKVRILGDINGDGGIDGSDLAIVAWSFGTIPGDTRWNPDADINHDGGIDGLDLVLIASNFGQSC